MAKKFSPTISPTVQQVANTVTATVKKKRIREDHLPQVAPGENTKYLNHNLEILRLPKINTNEGVAVQQRIEDYFSICAKNDMKPNIPGLALSLGIDRRTLWTWVNGHVNKPTEVVDTIKTAYQIINSMMEDWMQNGKINPVAGIFLMKNNMGYADKQEVVVTPNQPLGTEMSSEDLQQKYIDDVVFEVESSEEK